MAKQGYVYIIFNKKKGDLYTGVTSNLVSRIYHHKNKTFKGYSGSKGIDKLGYYEIHGTMTSAISAEKHIKSGSRQRKIELIETMNPEWRDLYYDII